MEQTRISELTNKYIDKDLSDAENTELKSLLEDSNNKKYFDETVALFNNLEKPRPVTAPASLKAKVMKEITQWEEQGWFYRMLGKLGEFIDNSRIGYPASFAMGGLMVFLIFLMLPQSQSIDDSFTKGFMADSDFSEIYQIKKPELNGAVKVGYSENIVILDVNLTSGELVDCELKFNVKEFKIYGIKTLEGSKESKIVSGYGSVKISNSEANRYMIFLRSLHENPGRINAEFYKNQTNLANISIDIKF